MIFKSISLSLVVAACLFSCSQKKENSEHQHAISEDSQAPDTVKKSLPKEEHAMVGNAHITIKYTAPIVKNRTLWGGLVAYDQVWVTGAHRATSFEINKDFEIGGKNIPAGKYAIFTIPRQGSWTFIINKNWDQHLADDYDAKDDVVRVEVTPGMEEPHQERLKYSIEDKNGNEAALSIMWEKMKLKVPFTVI